jgi:hypothetical protein
MALALADLVGVVAYPSPFDLDRALELGKKATGAGTALVTGKIVNLTASTGIWAQGTGGNTGRAGVVPKLYWGKDVNTDASANCVILTGTGAEVYVEAGGTIKPGSPVTYDAAGKAKIWTSGTTIIGHYVGHYGEGSGAGEPPTDATVGQPARIRLETGELT